MTDISLRSTQTHANPPCLDNSVAAGWKGERLSFTFYQVFIRNSAHSGGRRGRKDGEREIGQRSG